MIKLVFVVLKEILVGNKETRDILSGVTEACQEAWKQKIVIAQSENICLRARDLILLARFISYKTMPYRNECMCK